MVFVRWIELQHHYLSIVLIEQTKTCPLDKINYPLYMEITPEQLRWMREERRMTREELAAELDCSASAIVHWEGSKRAIPSWVADKMFAKLPITFTVQDLAEMYDLCREEAFTMSELIQEAVRSLIAQRRQNQTPPSTKKAPQSGYQTPHIITLPESKVAETPPPPPRKNGTED